MNGVRDPQHTGRRPHVRKRVRIRGLAPLSKAELFPFLAGDVGPLTRRRRRFVALPGLVEVERHAHHHHHGPGRPPSGGAALARAFIGRAIRDLPVTSAPVGRLRCDPPPPRGPFGRSPGAGSPRQTGALPGLRVVRGDPASRTHARGPGQDRVRRLGRGPKYRGTPRRRGTGEAGSQTEAGA